MATGSRTDRFGLIARASLVRALVLVARSTGLASSLRQPRPHMPHLNDFTDDDMAGIVAHVRSLEH